MMVVMIPSLRSAACGVIIWVILEATARGTAATSLFLLGARDPSFESRVQLGWRSRGLRASRLTSFCQHYPEPFCRPNTPRRCSLGAYAGPRSTTSLDVP